LAYHKKLAVILEIFGLKLNIESENEPRQEASSPSTDPPAADSSPAGVRLKKAKITGGVLIEEVESLFNSRTQNWREYFRALRGHWA
jgi:hypothetical protein